MVRDPGPAPRTRPARSQVTHPLGPLQFEVMEGLWLRHSATAVEITRGLNACRQEPLSTKTVLTCLTRLEGKGLVSHSKESRAYLFFATKSEEEVFAWYLAGMFRSIIDRFGNLAVAVFIEQIGEDPIRYRFLRQLVEGNDEGGGP